MFYTISDILDYNSQLTAWKIFTEDNENFVDRVINELLGPREGHLRQHFRQNIPLAQYAMYLLHTFQMGAKDLPEDGPARNEIWRDAPGHHIRNLYGRAGAGGQAQVVMGNRNDRIEVLWRVQEANQAQGEPNEE